jgi:hypothetical protein
LKIILGKQEKINKIGKGQILGQVTVTYIYTVGIETIPDSSQELYVIGKKLSQAAEQKLCKKGKLAKLL